MPFGDGETAFNAALAVNSSRLNTTIVFRGIALPVGAANKVPKDGLFVLVDSLTAPTTTEFYLQTSEVLSTPNFVKLSIGISPATGLFGDGSDGDATNPALTGGTIKSYNNLTISANTSWTGSGIIFVRVAGILDIQSGKVLTLANTSTVAASIGGDINAAVEYGSDGGNGALSRGVVIIIAREIIGTGTITGTAAANGSNAGAAGGTGLSGSPDPTEPTYGRGLAGMLVKSNGGTQGTTNPQLTLDQEDYFVALATLVSIENSSGGGGAGGSTVEQSGGARYGGGGGGGGGAAVTLVLITEGDIPAITINLTGGNGGNAVAGGGGGSIAGGGGVGGQGGSTFINQGGMGGASGGGVSNRGGGGGGGGAVALLMVGLSESATVNLTPGTGGTNGGGTGSAGSNGNADEIFIEWSDFMTLMNRGV